MKKTIFTGAGILLLSSFITAQYAHAAIALDRNRIIFDASQTSLSLSISNQNKNLPYLAQAWVEDDKGNKIEHPITALPPLQRVEPGAKSQVRLQVTGGATPLPTDRETLFYFNLREIPPKSKTPNTLQIALQTRVKLFYRPASLVLASDNATVPQKQVTLTQQGGKFRLDNPTGYYVTITQAATSEKSTPLPGFKAAMAAPKSSVMLSSGPAELGNHPVLTFINDYGGRPKLLFTCSGSHCNVTGMKVG